MEMGEKTTLAEFKVKRVRFHEKAIPPAFGCVPIHKLLLKASYEVAYSIGKKGKPNTIAEALVKPPALKMANIMLGRDAEISCPKYFFQMTPSAVEYITRAMTCKFK